MQTSENFPSETVWKFRISLTVDSHEGSKRSQKCHFAAFSASKQALKEPSSDFSNSFSRHLDE